MSLRIVLPLAAVAALAVPAGAHADLHHTVAPGESLTSIAAADRVSITALAGANRLARNARLIAGSLLRIPPPGSGIRSPAAPRSVRRSSPMVRRYTVQPGDTLTGVAAHHGVSVSYLATLNHLRPTALLIAGATLTLSRRAPRTRTARPPTRRYLVQPGDTLTGVAAHAGVSASYLASLNDLSPTALLIAGATLRVPGTAPTRGGPPYPTLQRVTGSQVEQIAAENRVSASLAAAIAWQESGFNNELVSSADARGVMQILPGTWDWIQDNLTSGAPLAPASAIDNVRGGVLYLHALLLATEGNVRLAVAGYVQGLASVRTNGMFAVTRQYVRDVLALREQFGGP
jgi:LysM repeat protein